MYALPIATSFSIVTTIADRAVGRIFKERTCCRPPPRRYTGGYSWLYRFLWCFIRMVEWCWRYNDSLKASFPPQNWGRASVPTRVNQSHNWPHRFRQDVDADGPTRQAVPCVILLISYLLAQGSCISSHPSLHRGLIFHEQTELLMLLRSPGCSMRPSKKTFFSARLTTKCGTKKVRVMGATTTHEFKSQRVLIIISVLYQCCLERDLSLFNAGDQTEVGEKGLTLSGGQKVIVLIFGGTHSHFS